jgi:hypothetical protein
MAVLSGISVGWRAKRRGACAQGARRGLDRPDISEDAIFAEDSQGHLTDKTRYSAARFLQSILKDIRIL